MKKYINIRFALVALLLTLIPSFVSAATVYMESSRSTISVGDTVIVSVKINAEGTTINTVEGDISTMMGGSSVAVQEFSLANSAFGLWPRTPSLSTDGQVISFVGGVPGGFNIEGATLFKIIYEAKKSGNVTISPQNIVAFANDGTGTKVPVKTSGITLKVNEKVADSAPQDEWKALVAQDVKPPEKFIIVLGQDTSLFEGKTFAFFSAVDNETGISYYEVSENGAPAVRSGSTYVLQNQQGEVTLEVTAYDKAGNKTQSSYTGSATEAPESSSMKKILGIVGIALIVVIVIVMVVRRMKTRTNNAQY